MVNKDFKEVLKIASKIQSKRQLYQIDRYYKYLLTLIEEGEDANIDDFYKRESISDNI